MHFKPTIDQYSAYTSDLSDQVTLSFNSVIVFVHSNEIIMKSCFHCDIVGWIEINNRVMDLMLACAT